MCGGGLHRDELSFSTAPAYPIRVHIARYLVGLCGTKDAWACSSTHGITTWGGAATVGRLIVLGHFLGPNYDIL